MGNNLGGLQRPIGRIWGEVKSPLYRNAIFLMMNSAAGSALGFFFWVIMVRVYSTDDIGFAVALFSTVSFVASLSLLGFNVSLVRYLPEADHKMGMINASLTIAGLCAIVLSLVYILCIAVFGLGLGFVLDSPVYIVGIVLGGLAVSLGTIFDSVALAARRADLSFWRGLSLGILKIPIALLFAITLSGPFGVGRLGVFMALVIGMGASVIIEGAWLLPRVMPEYRPRVLFNVARLRPLLRFSAGNYTAAAIGAAGSMLLSPLVLVIDGAKSVTYFYVAGAVASLLSVIPNAAFASFYSEASQKQANSEDRHRDERRALLLSLVLLVPAILGILLFAHFLIYILYASNEYADNATEVLQILVFGALPALVGSVLVTRVRIRRRSLPLIVGAAIATIVNLGVGYVWLQTGGINGLAMASILGAIAPLPYYWYVARRSFATEPIEPVEPTPLQP